MAAIESLPERLAERFGARASADTHFGKAIEREGVTVIPVGKVRYGFGGGGGKAERGDEGSGGEPGVA